MSASQRRKGRAWEQEVARLLREAGYDCRRGAQGAGEVEPDIVLLGDGQIGSVRPWIECGHGADMDGRVKWAQAQAAAERSGGRWAPVAVTKRDRQRAQVTVTVAGLAALVADPDRAGPLVVTLDLMEFVDAVRRRGG